MTMHQTPKQSAIFPVLPRERQMIDEHGMMTDYYRIFFDQLLNALQNHINPEGILVPAQTAADIALLTAVPVFPKSGSDTRVSNQNILYDSTNDEFKGNINGTWKTFTLT